jgi:hypothetical protein
MTARLVLAASLLGAVVIAALAWNLWRWERRAAVDHAIREAGFRGSVLQRARYGTPCPPGEDALVVTGQRTDRRPGEGYACVPAVGRPTVMVTEVDPGERLYLY